MQKEINVTETLKKFGLDFELTKIPLIGIHGGEQLITPYSGLWNTKTMECLNSVKSGYGISQNKDILEMVVKGCKDFGELEITKAGSIHGGRRVYIQMEVTGTKKVGSDIIKQYITVIDSNDGSSSLAVGIGDIVMRCENQFYMFKKNAKSKFRHTSSIEQRIQEIPQLINVSLSERMKQIDLYNKFLSTPVTKKLADDMCKYVLGNDRKSAELTKSQKTINLVDKVYSNIIHQMNDCGNNVWGLFNGITWYTTHEQVSPKRDGGKIESLLVGEGYKKNNLALEFATSLV